jgi:hypothetical protein
LVRDIFNRRWNLRLLNEAISALDVRYCQIILRVFVNGSAKDWEGGSYGQFEGTDLACAWRY